jgi:endoglucanase
MVQSLRMVPSRFLYLFALIGLIGAGALFGVLLSGVQAPPAVTPVDSFPAQVVIPEVSLSATSSVVHESARVNIATTSEKVVPISIPPAAEKPAQNPPPAKPPSNPSTPSNKVLSRDECETQIAGSNWYVDRGSQVARAQSALDVAGDTRAPQLRYISCSAHAVWITGNDPADDRRYAEKIVAAAAQVNAIPLIAIYHVTDAQTARWENGMDSDEYHVWIDAVSQGIGEASAWIILEPDALATSFSYSDADQRIRAAQLRDAVETIARNAPNARVYIDVGHSRWLSPEKAVTGLRLAGIESAHGFSLNVANYGATAEEKSYGTRITQLLGSNARFVIDTSRNGNGAAPHQWCNAPGRALGETPRMNTDGSQLDALVWIKPPGESDGYCNGGPEAGSFWLQYALDLVSARRR